MLNKHSSHSFLLWLRALLCLHYYRDGAREHKWCIKRSTVFGNKSCGDFWTDNKNVSWDFKDRLQTRSWVRAAGCQPVYSLSSFIFSQCPWLGFINTSKGTWFHTNLCRDREAKWQKIASDVLLVKYWKIRICSLFITFMKTKNSCHFQCLSRPTNSVSIKTLFWV